MLKRIQFYAVVIIPGAVLMALEIVSSRLLAPQFGSSVYVWGSIIGVFLAAMSIGYLWGGHLADARPHLADLGRLLIAAAFTQALVLLFGRTVVEALGAWTGGASWGTLVATSILFGPSTTLLATVAPYAVKLATADLKMLGGTAGHLYAISTGGSLLGTLGATFFLIPNLQLNGILRLLLLLTVLTGLGAIGAAWQNHRLATALALTLAILGLSGRLLPATRGDILAQRMTPYQTLEVTERDNARFLTSDGILHAAVDLTTRDPWVIYTRVAAGAMLFEPDLERLLVLGMGGGSVGSYLASRLPNLHVDHVDIDPAVPELARDLMFFEENERTQVHVDDARRFLTKSEKTWDFIYADTYIGHSIPFHLSTVEFFREVEKHLVPEGLLGVNLTTGPGTPYGEAFLKTVRQVFRQIYVFNVPAGNYFVLATNRGERWSHDQLRERGRQLDANLEFDPSLSEIADFLSRAEVDLSSARVLRDEFAPVNHLVLQGASSPKP